MPSTYTGKREAWIGWVVLDSQQDRGHQQHVPAGKQSCGTSLVLDIISLVLLFFYIYVILLNSPYLSPRDFTFFSQFSSHSHSGGGRGGGSEQAAEWCLVAIWTRHSQIHVCIFKVSMAKESDRILCFRRVWPLSSHAISH